MAVTLINVFTVPNGKEDEFVKWWEDVKDNITKQQGFISGKFHKSIKSDSRFKFINVAIWENEDLYWKAPFGDVFSLVPSYVEQTSPIPHSTCIH